MKAPHMFAFIAGFAVMTATAQPVAAVEATKLNTEITQADVEAAQAAWGEALIGISAAWNAGGIDAARAAAEEAIDTLYAYEFGDVLFRPTLASAPHTFRTTREAAIAYFVGHDENFPNDDGFALNGWTSFEVENVAIFIIGDVAKTMGNVRLTDGDGNVVMVDKTWGYKRDPEGALRITLHHSSLPFVLGES